MSLGKTASHLVYSFANGGSVPWFAADRDSVRYTSGGEQEWVDDPQREGRQVGWVSLPATEYARPVRRLALRCRKANGQWGIGVLISTLSPGEVLALTQPTARPDADAATMRLSYVYLYDQRGGGVETSFKGDHQGLGSTKRSKKRFEAQQMVMLLGTLAHTVVIWARRWLTQTAAAPTKLRHYGILRMVRDVFHISGFLVFDACGQRASGILTDKLFRIPVAHFDTVVIERLKALESADNNMKDRVKTALEQVYDQQSEDFVSIHVTGWMSSALALTLPISGK